MTAKDLGFYQNVYPFIKNYYVYLKKGNVVLEPGVYRDSKFAHTTIHEGDHLSYVSWMEMLNNGYEGQFVKIPKSDSQGTLAYIRSFKGDKTEQKPGSIVVLLDTEKLLEVIRNVRDYNGGEVMILDEQNQLLLSYSGKIVDPNLLPGYWS
jgi:hypothetical protein